jgi:hypothetical protein
MATTKTIIERIALGRAASAYLKLSDPAILNNPYAGYLTFRSAVNSFANPTGITLSQELENEHELALDLIHNLADSITRDIKHVLGLAKEGIVNETIECRLDSDMNTLDMPGLVAIGHSLEFEEDDKRPVFAEPASEEPDSEPEDQVLHYFEVGVTRVAVSSEQIITVLATDKDAASDKALDIAYDREFSSCSAEYECAASLRNPESVQPGAVLTWRDPANGEEQEVIFRKTYGDIVFCHTQGGGELEAFANELR